MDNKAFYKQQALENLISDKPAKRCSWYLFLCGWIADLLVISNGMVLAWTSPVIPQLQSNNTDINPLGYPISTLQVSILATIPALASTIAYSFWAKIIDSIGRKKTMRINSILLLCSLLTTAFSRYIWIYYIALAVTGVCISGGILSVAVYNTEIAEETNRGQLGCLMSMQLPIGILCMYVFGSLVGVRDFTLICGIPSVLHLLLSPLIPESPVFLTSKNRFADASKALQKLKSSDSPVYADLLFKQMKGASDTVKQSSFLELIKDPCARMAYILSMQIFVIEQLSGIIVIVIYVAPIFNQSDSGLSGNHVGILVGAVKLLTFFIATYFTDKLGRRTSLLFSTLSSAIAMFFLGLYFYLKHIQSPIIDKWRWVSVLCVIVYITVYALGLGSVPMAFAGEVFPDHLRVRGMALILISIGCLSSLVTFFFPIIANNFGLYSAFWICSSTSLIGFLSMYFTLPETRGKTFEEIQNILRKRLKK